MYIIPEHLVYHNLRRHGSTPKLPSPSLCGTGFMLCFPVWETLKFTSRWQIHGTYFHKSMKWQLFIHLYTLPHYYETNIYTLKVQWQHILSGNTMVLVCLVFFIFFFNKSHFKYWNKTLWLIKTKLSTRKIFWKEKIAGRILKTSSINYCLV